MPLILVYQNYFYFLSGLPNTSGLLSRRGQNAQFNADVIINLKKAGAIPVALTNVSELCMWYESSNLIYGRTNNAYHPGRMVGGSSGLTYIRYVKYLD